MKKGIFFLSVFSVIFILTLNSCKKDNTGNDDDQDPNDTTTVQPTDTSSIIIGSRNGEFYLKGLLDGDTLIIGNGSGVNNLWGSAGGGSSSTCTGAGVGYLFQQSAFIDDEEDIVILGYIHCANTGSFATCEEDLSGIKVGSYTIGNGEYGEGFYLEYYDKNRIKWTTEGNQSGSSVNISPNQLTSVNGASGYYYKAGGSISCKLYNSNGDVINLTNGTYNIRVGVCD